VTEHFILGRDKYHPTGKPSTGLSIIRLFLFAGTFTTTSTTTINNNNNSDDNNTVLRVSFQGQWRSSHGVMAVPYSSFALLEPVVGDVADDAASATETIILKCNDDIEHKPAPEKHAPDDAAAVDDDIDVEHQPAQEKHAPGGADDAAAAVDDVEQNPAPENHAPDDAVAADGDDGVEHNPTPVKHAPDDAAAAVDDIEHNPAPEKRS
jgi:hypothetical protein